MKRLIHASLSHCVAFPHTQKSTAFKLHSIFIRIYRAKHNGRIRRVISFYYFHSVSIKCWSLFSSCVYHNIITHSAHGWKMLKTIDVNKKSLAEKWWKSAKNHFHNHIKKGECKNHLATIDISTINGNHIQIYWIITMFWCARDEKKTRNNLITYVKVDSWFSHK